MKPTYKLLVLLISVSLVASCSKDDDNRNSGNGGVGPQPLNISQFGLNILGSWRWDSTVTYYNGVRNVFTQYNPRIVSNSGFTQDVLLGSVFKTFTNTPQIPTSPGPFSVVCPIVGSCVDGYFQAVSIFPPSSMSFHYALYDNQCLGWNYDPIGNHPWKRLELSTCSPDVPPEKVFIYYLDSTNMVFADGNEAIDPPFVVDVIDTLCYDSLFQYLKKL